MGSPDTVPEAAMKKLLLALAVLPDGVRYPEGTGADPGNGDFVGTSPGIRSSKNA